MDTLIPIGIVNLILLALLFFAYLNRKTDEADRATWQALADRHQGLTFHTRGLVSSFGTYLLHHFGRTQSYLSGRYCDCSLKLETYDRTENKVSQTYTRLQVTGPAGPVHFHQVEAPSTTDLTKADLLQLLLPNGLPDVWRWRSPGTIKIEPAGFRIIYEEPEILTYLDYLQTLLDFLIDLAHGHRKVLALGGQAVPGLITLIAGGGHIYIPIAMALLDDIAAHTRQQVYNKRNSLLCPYCCTRPGPLKVKPTRWKTVTYYGCRSCGQTNHFLSGTTVALLDQAAPAGPIEKNGLIQINWLARRELFDFDAVEIRNATDEDVERFVVQIGNDTDEWRRKRYAELGCTVSPDCQLSPNIRRILARQFGDKLEA